MVCNFHFFIVIAQTDYTFFQMHILASKYMSKANVHAKTAQ